MFSLCTMLFRDLGNLHNWGILRSVCNRPLFLFPSSLICRRSACSTNVTVSMSFGGRSWSIDPQDFNTGEDLSLSSDGDPFCLGAIFDLSQGSDVGPNSNGPDWVVGDTFLVRNISQLHSCPSYLVLFCRKMCTRCSVPTHRLLDLLSYLLRLVDKVRNPLGQFRALYSYVYLSRHGFRGLFS